MHLTKIELLADDYPTKKHYPFNIGLFQNTRELSFAKPITFFIGENGTGKSTLLKAIARKCNIHIWKGIDRTVAEYNRYQDALHLHMRVKWRNGSVKGSFFGADSFGNYAKIVEEWASSDPGVLDYFGGASLVTKSHGQCNMAYFRSRFDIEGLYLLDEPETALSPTTQIELVRLLGELMTNEKAQFVISTHSPILLALPGADIYSFNGSVIEKVRYEDTDYYKVYKDFLNNRSKYLS
jgi:predicted ATPase